MGVRSLLEFNANEIASILNDCFEGYLLPVQFTAKVVNSRFRAEHLDAAASFVYLKNDLPQGIILVARRGKTSRIAAMGVATEARVDIPHLVFLLAKWTRELHGPAVARRYRRRTIQQALNRLTKQTPPEEMAMGSEKER